MRAVYKYELYHTINELNLPKGSKFLHAAVQHEKIQAWFLVPVDDNFGEDEHRTLVVVGTGQTHNFEEKDYLGTVLTENGNLVWHIFERSQN